MCWFISGASPFARGLAGCLVSEGTPPPPALRASGAAESCGILRGEMWCRVGRWSLGLAGREGRRDTAGCPVWICRCAGGGLGQPKSWAWMSHAWVLQIIRWKEKLLLFLFLCSSERPAETRGHPVHACSPQGQLWPWWLFPRGTFPSSGAPI